MWKLQRLRLRGSHKCYMLQKDIKPHSEKYVYFDFETKLDPKTNKHVVFQFIAEWLIEHGVKPYIIHNG